MPEQAKSQRRQKKKATQKIAPPIRVPKLAVARISRLARKHRPRKGKNVVSYVSGDHKKLPHVIKFSGGRSSGLLLFMLLENNLLRADRGDVVIFNNTSAEHPKTYQFAEKCKRVVEDHYGIPFFWLEFQTYEDVRSGDWSRIQTYRLVKPRPRSRREPDGYRYKGEAFEEMLSWAGYVPNLFSRICTKKLKLETTRLFLQDWFACKEGIQRQGHFGKESRLTDSSIIERHKRNGGAVPSEILLKKKDFLRNQSVYRPEQSFADYSDAFQAFNNPVLKDAYQNGNGKISEEDGVEYAAFIGLRSDEMHRVVRTRERNSGESNTEGINGEHVYMPLADNGLTREDVNRFWERQRWDLGFKHGANMSNCVYCFLKGAGKLRQLNATVGKRLSGKLQDTPSDIQWWSKIEKKYGRDLIAEERVETGTTSKGFIGFFGSSGLSYERLALTSKNPAELQKVENVSISCDCTD